MMYYLLIFVISCVVSFVLSYTITRMANYPYRRHRR